MSEWRDISTAPSEGKFLIGGWNYEGRDRPPLWDVEDAWREGDGFACDVDEDGNLVAPTIDCITHWMPLPEPPAGIRPHVQAREQRPSGEVWEIFRSATFKRDGRKCRYCGNEDGPFDIDHVVPLARGGQTIITNLVVACRSCNLSKGTKLVEEWKGEADGRSTTSHASG